MLEVKHLKKVYKLKNANPVFALNDVSLKFPQTGLVFILGKSGSGKSTLLNVMGGLDRADEGEIIINGKSSNDFTSGEMDAYRNTYLGFIFQEYNILSDYTVKENIALALQLQHKKATDEEIEKILSQVDLSGYGKRKPNELSGGQKQRVAIARALVKEPKIIFGDEPTGALDSNTGKQVFETLKKLSKDKLVVIVSHDRDFAEHFGDRVIELRDGKVISDISKFSVEAKKPSDGISIMGKNVIRIDKARQLTVEDLPILNKMIVNSENDVFVTADGHVNDALCEAARIDKSGNRQEFFKTDEDSINLGEEKFSVIKSKFSFAHAFKMGFKSMRVKPFRLVMTILLSVVSFTMFGGSATMGMFNSKEALLSTAKKEELGDALVRKTEPYRDGMVDSDNGFTDEDLATIKEKTGLTPYKIRSTNISFDINTNGKEDSYHLLSINNIVTIDDDLMKDSGFTIACGRLPENEGEFCISEYAYQSFEDYGIGYEGNKDYIRPEDVTMDSVLGLNFSSYNTQKNYLVLTGIIDTHLDPELENYRHAGNVDYSDPNRSKLNSLRYDSVHSLGYVGKEKNEDGYVNVDYSSLLSIYKYEQNSSFGVNKIDSNSSSHVLYSDKNKTSLASNEMVISLYNLYPFFDNDSQNTYFYTFEGAKSAFGLNIDYSVDSIGEWLLNSYSIFQNAAKLKTIDQNYLDFFENQKDEVIKINEGKEDYSTGLDCIPYKDSSRQEYDFDATEDYAKYNIFKKYVDTKVYNDSKPYLNDTKTKYYTFYKDAFFEYVRDFSRKNFTDFGLGFLYNFYSMYLNFYDDEFCAENMEEFYRLYGNEKFVQEIFSSYPEYDFSDKNLQYVVFKDLLNYIGERSQLQSNSILKKHKSQFAEGFEEQLKKYSLNLSNEKLSFKVYSQEIYSATIVGVEISLDSHIALTKEDCLLINKELSKIGGVNSNYEICLFFKNNFSGFEKFLDYYDQLAKRYEKYDYDKIPEGCYRLNFQTSSLNSTENVASMLLMLTKVFLYIGIAFALFSMLLFYNFISISINNKKREIGILRAVGAKRSDVFKIFYSESSIIALINFLFSTFFVFLISFFMNNMMSKEYSLQFSIMNPNLWIVLLIFGIALITSLLASLIPVLRIANKKPIDAIQNR